MHVYEIFAQDKWQPTPGMTVSAGLRYDLEIMPVEEDPGNPLFTDPSKYPVDKNNICAAARASSGIRTARGKSALRAGYGIFYDKTLLGTIDNFFTDTKYAMSFEAHFPTVGPDLGPRNGQFPTDPALLTNRVDQLTPAVRAYINSLYPPGTTRAQHRHGDLGRSRARAAVLPPDQRRLRARNVQRRVGVGRLRPDARDATCSSIRT